MLIKADMSSLLVIDVQERLAPAMSDIEGVIANTSILLQAANRLAIPQLVSEQYPNGLGRTLDQVASLNEGPIVEKMSFSCMGDKDFVSHFKKAGREQAVIVGIEAHVCVLQTAMDLLSRDVQVFVVADATSSRKPESHALAMNRLRGAGAEIVSTEMVVFEWLEKADAPEFKKLSRLIK